ncbi:MAG: CGLD27 family protein [Cyanobacteriota bacterium]|nr:CGLD27 family protein [Cyanobacteriota bacterium]
MREPPTGVCPVPSEQQPVNEYEQLKESSLFCWPTLEVGVYTRKLIWVWLWGWLVAGPIAAASFSPPQQPLRFVLSGGGGALIFAILILLRLYLGWSYVRDRLSRETVFYEESGWYDGQTWPKPPEMLTRDRLIVAYQVQPLLDRLKRSFAIVALLIGIGSLAWWTS